MDLDSYGNSFTSLSDLSQMFASAETPPDANDLDLIVASRCYSVVDRNPVAANTVPAALTVTKSSCKADRTGGGGGRRSLLNKERERRGKMARMYSLLHSFLPNLVSDKQASREKIVSETIGLIKRLEADKSRLEQEIKAKETAASTFCAAATASTVTISTFTGCFSASSHAAVAFEIKWRRDRVKQRTSLTHVLEVFDMYGAEIFAASVVVKEGIATASVTAAIVGGEKGEVVEKIKRDLLRLQV